MNSIEDALRFVSHPQHVQVSSITKGGATVDATQQILIETLPPVLVLHLKRFHYDTSASGVVKIGKQVTFGPELEIPSGTNSTIRSRDINTNALFLFRSNFIWSSKGTTDEVQTVRRCVLCSALVIADVLISPPQLFTTMGSPPQGVTILSTSCIQIEGVIQKSGKAGYGSTTSLCRTSGCRMFSGRTLRVDVRICCSTGVSMRVREWAISFS